MRINLTDNNIRQPDTVTFQRKDVAALFPIADKTIAELCKENENLLIFPYSIETSCDKICDSPVMNILNTGDSDKVQITTGNVMGFIGIDNLQIKIKSRFDKGRDDFFLHYMLQKVLSLNLFDLKHNDEQEDIFDFIMFMFPYLLKAAMNQGVYREYKNYKRNDSNLKGTIDIGRHIARNVPFVGNIAYSTREYSHDNNMSELIRHTIEFMKTKRYGQLVLNIDRKLSRTLRLLSSIHLHTIRMKGAVLSARISGQRFTHTILSIVHSRRSASRFSEWKRLNMVKAATKSAESYLMERGFGKNMSTQS